MWCHLHFISIYKRSFISSCCSWRWEMCQSFAQKTMKWPSLGPVMQSLVMSLENVCTVCFSKLCWGAWIVLIVFPFWTAGWASENYHSVWKDRYLATAARQSELNRDISPCYVFSRKFIPICSVQQQEALDKKRLFSSWVYYFSFQTCKKKNIFTLILLQCDTAVDNENRELKSMAVKLVLLKWHVNINTFNILHALILYRCYQNNMNF